MVSPISVPGNQPSTTSAVNTGTQGRRNSQSLGSGSLFSPFSPPGGTSVAAAAALGTSPPTATNISLSSSSTAPGFGTGFRGGSGLARSISNGKQIGQTPLMSPTTGGMAVVNDKGARAQGILRRLSLGSGARPNFGRPVASSPPPMPLAMDNSVDQSHTDITSTTEYLHTLPPPQNAPTSSSALAPTANASKSATSPSFYANPFSGAVLHEAHDEHEHDLVSGMTSFSIGKKGDSNDGAAHRRASSAVTSSGSGWNVGSSGRQEGIDGLPRPLEHPDGAARARKISFGWSGFMSGKKDANAAVQAAPSRAERPNSNDANVGMPPSILVRRESAPISPPATRTTLNDQSQFKFGTMEGTANKVPVSVTVQPVSPSPAARGQDLDSRNTTVSMPSQPQPQLPSSSMTTTTSGSTISSSNAKLSPSGKTASSSGLLGLGGATTTTNSRGRKGAETAGPGGGGKKRSVSPMAEHILRGGPGQF
ncbi:hypothetical protein QFC21_000131 [Naganishia friedmannii]|uniref:Uncharacterized protein n=1 Tax=Naganishia friedmannii TaxID=89922 RepID=A0ACC2WCK7_9TREE|nr:hypothetical protein QFC21_000131 [Naganishia friedmannii]